MQYSFLTVVGISEVKCLLNALSLTSCYQRSLPCQAIVAVKDELWLLRREILHLAKSTSKRLDLFCLAVDIKISLIYYFKYFKH